jgi:hypothetical protein
MDIILVSRNIIVDCLGVLAAMPDPTMVGSEFPEDGVGGAGAVGDDDGVGHNSGIELA